MATPKVDDAWRRSRLTDWQRGILTPDIVTAARDLFEHLGRPAASVRPVDPKTMTWMQPISLIGFAGSHAVGALAISPAWSFLRETHPFRDGATEDDLLDWSREIGNLLLGHIKLMLLRRNVVVEIGLPATILGRSVEVVSLRGKAIGVRAERAGGEFISILFDAAVAPEMALLERPESARAAGDPGFVLF